MTNYILGKSSLCRGNWHFTEDFLVKIVFREPIGVHEDVRMRVSNNTALPFGHVVEPVAAGVLRGLGRDLKVITVVGMLPFPGWTPPAKETE